MTNAKTVTAKNFHAEIWGWSIDQGPPPVPGDQKYAPGFTTPVQVDTCTTHVVPPQTLDLSTGIITPTDNLNLTDAKWDGGQSAWHITSSFLVIKAPTPCAITLTFEAKAVSHSAHLTVSSFPAMLGPGPGWSTRLKIHTHSFQTYTVVMPPTAWKEGFKSLFLTEDNDGGSKVVVRSISASTEQVDIQASYFWRCVFQGHVNPGATASRGISVTNGVSTTDTETNSFATTIGAEVSAGLEGIGAKLSSSFTYQHGSSHSITVSKQTTTTDTFSVTAHEEAITFQFWQLCMRFNDNKGSEITQAIDASMAPYVECSYTSADASAQPALESAD